MSFFSAEKDLEIEKLRREISSLRYEKNEDQLTISELRRKNDNMVEEHKKNIQDLEEKNRYLKGNFLYKLLTGENLAEKLKN